MKLGIKRRKGGGAAHLLVEITKGARAGETVELPLGEHTIGSKAGSAVHLTDEGVSASHATLTVTAGRVILRVPIGEVVHVNDALLKGRCAVAIGNVLKVGEASLRLASPAGAEAGDGDESGVAGKARVPGIKRRSKGDAPGGVKRRSKGEPAKARAAETPDKPKFRYGNDMTGLELRKFFNWRPKMKFDESIFQLKRTHGHYWGDARDTRMIPLPWRPCHVLYTVPRFPDFPPGYWPPGGGGKFTDPGPAPQPEFTAEGFLIDLKYNQPGEQYMYVAWTDEPIDWDSVRTYYLLPGADPH
jgi:hypothetical protein